MKKGMLLIIGVVLLFSCKQDLKFGQEISKSGYEYTIHIPGSGKSSEIGDYVKMYFEVVGSDGNVYEASKGEEYYPIVQMIKPVDGKPNPLTDILTGTKEGDSLSIFFIPDSLGNVYQSFQHLSYLAYNFKIIEVYKKEDYEAKLHEEKQRKANLAADLQIMEEDISKLIKKDYQRFLENDDSIKITESGIRYLLHEEGTGTKLQTGDAASINFYGILRSDGSLFDNSFREGQPLEFKVGQGQVIKGWEELVLLFPKGSKFSAVIPAELAYGAASKHSIPSNSDLIFYMEIRE